MKIVTINDSVSLKRDLDTGTDMQQDAVHSIIAQVREQGDQALFTLTKQFDGADLTTLRVQQAEIEAAYREMEEPVLQAIGEAIENIRDFHERQKRNSWMTTKPDGTILGQKITPLDSVGLYVPGGKAAYPSSIMMNVIPAQVAGVQNIVIVSPPQKDGSIPAGVLVTAAELGVKTILKVGGAQAIAALAYGTESVPAVDKITGPGNIYVALAKRAVFGHVDIDMIAGPSEIVVLADERANPRYIAADLLSQAEHDERASAILVTPSRALAEEVAVEVDQQLTTLPKREIAAASIRDYGAIYVTETLEEAVSVVNELAPEHLEILAEEPMSFLGKIRHAGAIFLGPYSSEPVGDYFAGPNHVLPTNGTARFSSPLNVDDFVKKSSIISYSKAALLENGAKISALARLEGLEAHARAIDIRLEDER
ncbi:histidinol dehydrogenase [Halalkalibacterium halodurans]|uniref:Histidinol dehydrogenase n=2 Tax=Halalkalibacterium halodurans TaxID=86665 RepID=A0A0M0KGQ3_ALKHA|nr:histidinol dehydrogenase [Halalkalibacterium halodurans]MED4083045.1 histidinol dehydrogenase [Halalkalibacterium halodurans]MED4087193.1 histidinol dehydrogenase [Halalkalibacterium halodurans]MED4106874.1 histidinol dehydrogenase [Halalkalibacterium halodurans]MED4192864.1 histidinol dehydrogenase [Halalkalibacterium halodurans]MED4196944.1 histidinol dehydrogenase [Halalkalibacterium halodurans]